MTDITDQDRRKALAWSGGSQARGGADAAARYILATVEAPEPTLAEELRDTARWWREGAPTWEQCCDRFESLAARAEQIEQERDQALAEVERLTAERDREKTISKGWMDAHQKLAEHHAETLESAVQKDAESSDLPDPADVKPGEAWYLGVAGVPTVGFKVVGTGWTCYSQHSRTSIVVENNLITLVSRLVPAPRQITTREILDEAPRRTVIRDKDGVVCERASLGDGWYSPESTTDQTDYIKYPATVLWTPEETK